MRFMMTVIPKGYGAVAPDAVPTAEAVAKMTAGSAQCCRRPVGRCSSQYPKEGDLSG